MTKDEIFILLRDCRRAIGKAGWSSKDYELSHEQRMIAKDCEDGKFEEAMKAIKNFSKGTNGNK